MSYECEVCGEAFDTLSRKRLHECPEGARYGSAEDPDEDIPVADMDPEAMADLAVERLLICDTCGESVEEVDSFEDDMSSSGVSFAAEFTCPSCGTYNENSATLE